MSVFAERYPQNVPGKYYVTDQCTDCDLCRESAPHNIRRNNEEGYSYVYRQPTTPEEIAGCERGVAGCPTEAVGNDGDRAHYHAFQRTAIGGWLSRAFQALFRR